MIPYKKLPKVSEFQSDSNDFNFNARSGDPILKRIDEVLGEYRSNRGWMMGKSSKLREIIILGRLYSAIDIWLKEAKFKPKTGKWSTRCLPAVQSLYQIACMTLADRVGVPINQLPFWLTETYGRGLSEHGVLLDLDKKFAKYMDSAEADLCRIQFKAGKAYMRLLNVGSVDLVLASSDVYKDDKLFGVQYQKYLAGHAGYALSMGGDFYMGQHRVGGKVGEEYNLYHSSYRSGDAVRCAGTWKIENGTVKEISDSSGHYKPNLNHMITAVETLKTYGVNISELLVHFLWKGNYVVGVKGSEFLNAKKRSSLIESRKEYVEGHAKETEARNKM